MDIFVKYIYKYFTSPPPPPAVHVPSICYLDLPWPILWPPMFLEICFIANMFKYIRSNSQVPHWSAKQTSSIFQLDQLYVPFFLWLPHTPPSSWVFNPPGPGMIVYSC